MTDMQASRIDNVSVSNSDSLMLALFIAALVHVIIVLGIHFSAPEAPKISRSIDITLSHAPLKKPPKQAKYLAPDHQLGAGEDKIKPEPINEHIPIPVQHSIISTQKALIESNAEFKKPVVQKTVSQPVAPVKIAASVEQTDPRPELAEQAPKLSAEAIQQQIAQLGERIRTSQQSAQDAKIKFVNSVSTHKYLAAQYVKDWEDKVERTGNLNYPEAARHKGESQTLTMDVGINADGSIYSMRIVKSSGNQGLDEAAKHIVKMSAPFAELPYDLLQELNVLVITRVWKFSDETGMTTR